MVEKRKENENTGMRIGMSVAGSNKRMTLIILPDQRVNIEIVNIYDGIEEHMSDVVASLPLSERILISVLSERAKAILEEKYPENQQAIETIERLIAYLDKAN